MTQGNLVTHENPVTHGNHNLICQRESIYNEGSSGREWMGNQKQLRERERKTTYVPISTLNTVPRGTI